MTKEDKELLLNLLLKLDEDGLLNIYDNDENYHHVEWIYLNGGEIHIKID